MSSPDHPIRLSLDGASPFIDDETFHTAETRAIEILGDLLEGRGPGSEFTGWVDLPSRAGDDVAEATAAATELRGTHPALVVIGIGGSSLGARAGLAALGHDADERYRPGGPRVVFAGHHLSGDLLRETLDSLADVDYAVNVVSKSGTTTEPGIAFRVFVEDLKKRHGADWTSRVVATTDARRGALRALADEEGLKTFAVPEDVGGRFSVLTPVGLFPLAFAGVDAAAMVTGAADMECALSAIDPAKNEALRLSAMRHALYRAGFSVDVLSFTSPRLRHLAGWWQQLFGESEGKEGRGPFPGVLELPADLHSLGQYLQEGHRQVYETFLHVERPAAAFKVPPGDERDGLGYLEGRPLSEVLAAAHRGTVDAHLSGNTPVIELAVDGLDARTVGALFYFFEMVVAISGRLLDVNPFDQPGVEAYKRNMFHRLGRPGY